MGCVGCRKEKSSQSHSVRGLVDADDRSIGIICIGTGVRYFPVGAGM